MKRILITGASGFIGSHIWRLLAASGVCELIAGTRDGSAQFDKNFYIDLAKPESFIKQKEKYDVIINCAAAIKGSEEKIFKINCAGFLHLLNWAKKTGCQQFIQLSSVPVIGKPTCVPIRESHPARPQTFYHLSKLYNEQLLALPTYGSLNPLILRIPSPLGRGMDHHTIVPVFLRQAMRDGVLAVHGQGGRVQNYMDARDIAKAVHLAMIKEITGLYNLSGHSLSNLQVAQACIDFCHAGKVEFNGKEDIEENQRWIINTDKFYKATIFKPGFSFTDSLSYLAKDFV